MLVDMYIICMVLNVIICPMILVVHNVLIRFNLGPYSRIQLSCLKGMDGLAQLRYYQGPIIVVSFNFKAERVNGKNL